jgi:hypothetical protein
MVRTASSGVKFVNKYKDVTNLFDGSPIMRYAEVSCLWLKLMQD